MAPARLSLACVLALSALSAPEGPGPRQADAQEGGAPERVERSATSVTRAPGEERRAALARGLEWLAARAAQSPDGALPAAGAREHAPVASTALAALAWMAGGSTPGRGPQGAVLERSIDWLVAHSISDPLHEHAGYIVAQGDLISRTHGHGFATLALAEAFTLTPGRERGARWRDALLLAVRRIVASQGLEGGWYYQPVRSAEHEGSVTIALVQALRAARNAGVAVDVEVIRRAVSYVKRLQRGDGSFRYSLGLDRTSVALTAAGIATLNATGEYRGRELDDAYDWIFRQLAARENAPPSSALERLEGEARFPYYERLYLAQAFWQHPDPAVAARWYEHESARVLAAQRPDGSWSDTPYGDSYATAMNCLVLALPEGLLPIFQR